RRALARHGGARDRPAQHAGGVRARGESSRAASAFSPYARTGSEIVLEARRRRPGGERADRPAGRALPRPSGHPDALRMRRSRLQRALPGQPGGIPAGPAGIGLPDRSRPLQMTSHAAETAGKRLAGERVSRTRALIAAGVAGVGAATLVYKLLRD